MAGAEARMLDGITVLDFTQYLAGPTVTRFMAEMGATIIKVEMAPNGDPGRLLPYYRAADGRSVYHVQQNRGKKSLCLDFSRPETADLIRELVATVDVVVENFGPGVLEKRGLDWPSLSAVNPRLVMASISAFGRTGPMAHKVGFDLIAQAFSGIMHMTGDPDDAPSFVAAGIADVSTGVHAFGAIGWALLHRDRTGKGTWIDLAMVDCMYAMHEANVQYYAATNGAVEPKRFGRWNRLAGPYGVYKGPTGWLVILALERQWPNLCQALGQPELEHDPRFETLALRGQNAADLAAIIEAWMATFPDDKAALDALDAARVPCGPVQSIADTVTSPHYLARDMVRTLEDPYYGTVTIPGFPLKFSDQPPLPDLKAALLGEHNGEVLRDRLGWSDAQIRDLEARGVLRTGPI